MVAQLNNICLLHISLDWPYGVKVRKSAPTIPKHVLPSNHVPDLGVCQCTRHYVCLYNNPIYQTVGTCSQMSSFGSTSCCNCHTPTTGISAAPETSSAVVLPPLLLLLLLHPPPITSMEFPILAALCVVRPLLPGQVGPLRHKLHWQLLPLAKS